MQTSKRTKSSRDPSPPRRQQSLRRPLGRPRPSLKGNNPKRHSSSVASRKNPPRRRGRSNASPQSTNTSMPVRRTQSLKDLKPRTKFVSCCSYPAIKLLMWVHSCPHWPSTANRTRPLAFGRTFLHAIPSQPCRSSQELCALPSGTDSSWWGRNESLAN